MSRLLEQLLHLADGGGGVLAVDQFRAFEDFFHPGQCGLCGGQRFLFTAEFLVGEILDEGGSSAAEGKTPALECGGFVCEAG